MTTQTEALKLALEALEDENKFIIETGGEDVYRTVITAVQEALAQPEQRSVRTSVDSEHLEPVGTVDKDGCGLVGVLDQGHDLEVGDKLYTTQPQPKDQEQVPVAWVWNPAKEEWQKVRAYGHWLQGAIYAFGPTMPDTLQSEQKPDLGGHDVFFPVGITRPTAEEVSRKPEQFDLNEDLKALQKDGSPIPAKPEQEPVAWMTPDGEGFRIRFSPPVNDVPLVWDALYTIPPQRKPLTESERFQLRCQWNPEVHGAMHDYIIQQTEAAHGIKE